MVIGIGWRGQIFFCDFWIFGVFLVYFWCHFGVILVYFWCIFGVILVTVSHSVLKDSHSAPLTGILPLLI